MKDVTQVAAPHAEFTVVMPVFNARRYLPEAIGALARELEREPLADAVIVDNGSTDGSWEYLLAHCSGRMILRRHAGVTVAGVRNFGARGCQAPYLVFIDADCVMSEGYLANARELLSHPSIKVTGSRYALPSNPTWTEKTWELLHRTGEDGLVAYINAGNLVVARDVFERAGGFNERLLTGEDSEFCARIRQSGQTVYSADVLRVVHLGNPKTLRAFFFQQAWHGVGMFGTARVNLWNKPLLMLGVHLALVLATIPELIWGPGGWVVRVLAGLAMVVIVPAAAVVFRTFRAERLASPLRSLLMYEVYFAARLFALWRILRRGRADQKVIWQKARVRST